MAQVQSKPAGPIGDGAMSRVLRSRKDWTDYADALLDAVAPWVSPEFARITLPGPDAAPGSAVDGLEGFARTFLLAAFRIAGERGRGVDELIDRYSRGIVTGVDADAPDRWVRVDEHPQAKVEAASIALALDLTRPWIWDRLDARTRERVIAYFAPVVGDDTYPRTNWVWFRIVVQTFLRSVGGPWSAADIEADLACHDAFAQSDGWISDGFERSYDHYVGWALHLYPVLWPRMRGADDFAASRAAADAAALDRYLQDAVHLVGADGSPLMQGRSLIYRFAAAAPFWLGVIAEVPSTSPSLLRDTAAAIVGHFGRHGVPDERGLLTLGWYDEWPRLAQSYSGSGSPYWAVKGLMGIVLPADHPVWSAPPEMLAVRAGDDLRVVEPAGWIVSGTADDGIVRVVNHGTDHARAGALVGDSPLYARFGYSTAVAPLLNGAAWAEPLEQAVVLVDRRGRATHRAAMKLLAVRTEGEVAYAASSSQAHWISPDAEQVRHGSGITGEIEIAGCLVTHSVVRGPWEVRVVQVASVAEGVDADDIALRVGGWALADAVAPAEETDGVHLGELQSVVLPFDDGLAEFHVERRTDASPLGAHAGVPVLTLPVMVGTARVVGIGLGRPLRGRPVARVDGDRIEVSWPDGVNTVTVGVNVLDDC